MSNRYLFRGVKHVFASTNPDRQKEWVYGSVYENESGETFILEKQIEIRLQDDYWEHSYGIPPSEDNHYIKGMVEVIPETVGMWTGLTDKNGINVFEHDVCLDHFGRKLKIVYHNHRLRFEWIERPITAHFKYADFIDWFEHGLLGVEVIQG